MKIQRAILLSSFILSIFISTSAADSDSTTGNQGMMMGNPGMMGRGPGMMRGNRMGMMNGMGGMSMLRHRYVMQNGIAPAYRNKTISANLSSSANLDKGKALYQTNCATCHGASGIGDGVAGTNLNPRPANIARFSKMPMASDSYLYWTIAEGGIPVKSAMPPFKAQLEELEIWQIITYLRNL
jgi:mono/diheme cytochrome c family protein